MVTGPTWVKIRDQETQEESMGMIKGLAERKEGTRPLKLELQMAVSNQVGAGRRTQGLWKSSKCPYPLSLFSSPPPYFTKQFGEPMESRKPYSLLAILTKTPVLENSISSSTEALQTVWIIRLCMESVETCAWTAPPPPHHQSILGASLTTVPNWIPP